MEAGTLTTYTQDYAAPLPVVLQAKVGSVATQYVYCLGTRPPAEYEAAAWEYLLADALGSVRQIATTNAEVTLLKSYEPYGSALNSQGSATSIFGYAGEQVDAGTGLTFLRARYYSTGLGQFLSRDPLGTLSAYRYASSNPINRVDPSGYIDWPTCVIQGDYGTCTIWDGDTLYRIAREINAAGVPVDVPQIVADLIALNPQIQGNPNYLRIGDSLTLRAGWINAVLQNQSPAPSVFLPPPPVTQPLLPPVDNCPPANNIPLLTYSEGSAGVIYALFGQHGAWIGREIVYNLLTMEKVTFDVRGTVIARQSFFGMGEADYYSFATGISKNINLARSYAGHFYNHCASVSTPWISVVGLVECGFASPDGSIIGQSLGTFLGGEASIKLPIPSPSYADLDYNFIDGVTRKFLSPAEMKADILAGADSPIFPNRAATQIIQPMIDLSRKAAAGLIDQLHGIYIP